MVQGEHTQNSGRSWVNVPYNYFFVVFYLLLGIALSIHPANETTLEMAGAHAAFVGRLLGVIFMVAAFAIWRKEPQQDWLMIAAMPGVVWGAFLIVHLLGQNQKEWSMAVYIGASAALLMLCAELRQKSVNGDVLVEKLIKENLTLKTILDQQQGGGEQTSEQRPTQ